MGSALLSMNCARHNWHPLPVGSPTMSNSFRPSDAGSRHVQDSNNFSMKLQMIADCQTSFYGDSVWIFYPPVFILGFAKQTPGTSQKPKCMATLKLREISSSLTKEILWMLLQLRFQLHWCGLLQFGRPHLFEKVENTSMLQLLPFKDAANWTLHYHFHAEFQRCVVIGWWPPTQSHSGHSGLSWTYLHSLTRLKLQLNHAEFCCSNWHRVRSEVLLSCTGCWCLQRVPWKNTRNVGSEQFVYVYI